MKIYKFLQHGEWPVLIMAKTKAKAKYQLYRFAQAMSRGGYDSFMECLQDFKSAGTISKEEAKALIDSDDADVNGAKNILQRFLDGQFTVARGTQRA